MQKKNILKRIEKEKQASPMVVAVTSPTLELFAPIGQNSALATLPVTYFCPFLKIYFQRLQKSERIDVKHYKIKVY